MNYQINSNELFGFSQLGKDHVKFYISCKTECSTRK
jgi:hypothetical protein